ncbi:E3 ubiquitin-protein ligase MSL2 [Crotalus adamanteus]|uniref:E3 ubiquitin-protein ligase MSL2 n=1 Tax=Crotalus adamanteus TaxID=8729 RepID=A0AAW1BFG2_CROAD
MVLSYGPGEDPQCLAEIGKLLPYFRQSLSCCVCGNLLQDPIAPTNSTCQHYVCKTCKGKKMMMKPSCSWCKDYEHIAVRNASTSTSVINMTGSPVTTFLAASTNDDKILDEAMDMRYDC